MNESTVKKSRSYFQLMTSLVPLAASLLVGLLLFLPSNQPQQEVHRHSSSSNNKNNNAASAATSSIVDLSIFPHIQINEINDTTTTLVTTVTTTDNDNTNNNRRRLSKKYETGSFANCDPSNPTSRLSTSTLTTLTSTSPPHPDSATTIISCRTIHYRAPMKEIENGGSKIIVGVLSGAGGKGPLHRDSIRSTWARDRKGIYFIVAGPWEVVKVEYEKYRDLIWIEEEEVYEGEESVLPFKTEIFLHILHKYSLPGQAGFEYLFKTDDDSYVDLTKLAKTIVGTHYDYWGCCTTDHFRPLRSPTRKWRVTFELYPEEYYPLYCQGAGFAMSRKFITCISTNLENFRYNPFEDVSVGLLAERCGIKAVSDFARIRQYRTDDASEKKMLNDSKKEEIFLLPRASMQGKILQHRVKTHYDMYAHHKCVAEGC